MVSLELADETDTATLLAQIQQNAAAVGGDFSQGGFQLRTAVAALTEQRIPGQAFRMQSCQHRAAISDVAKRQCKMLLAAGRLHERMQAECRPRGGQIA